MTATILLQMLLTQTDSGGSLLFPKQASTVAADSDALFYFILALSTLFFVGIVAVATFFVFKYRRRSPGQKTSPVHGNVKLEVIWTAVPGLLLMVIFVWGFRSYLNLAVPPGDAIDVRVTGQRWSWSFEYPRDGIKTTGELVVPVGRPVRLTMSSVDVIHSFFVPAFRIKKDVVPNRYSVTWFEATEEGEYDLMCAEYCGSAHSQMLGRIVVKSEREYNTWIASGGGQNGAGMTSVEFGQSLFKRLGCEACHSVDGSKKIGPTMQNKYGTEEQLADGSKQLVDDNYLRQSFMEPQAKIVMGYPPVMPTFAGRLNDAQTNALIDYIKSLGQPATPAEEK